MTQTIDPVILNFLYAALGGVLTLFFMWLGCLLFNRLVCSFNIPEELSKVCMPMSTNCSMSMTPATQ